jgi:eukaryotic-like serine/threonine-protein kinase
MTLSAGLRLGAYEIVSPLGAGGMGEVYRARDSRLNRDVAIKVLPADFAEDVERVARLRREAQLVASLNHPHIAAIHGLEESNGTVALILELVDGEDLAQRISRGALPVDEAIFIARQITDGLEAAHEHGVVHRDLKPANVKLTRDGVVKILDFGLAKAYEVAGTQSVAGLTQSPTMSRHMTEAGVILGTAAYMSPEQARGRPVDKRADIWSFGVVLYEMLTGRPPFHGDTVSDLLASVIKDVPDLKALEVLVTPGLARLIERCLEKDPRSRLRDIGDARHALDEIGAAEPPVTPLPTKRSRLAATAPWLLSVVLAVVALVLWSRPERTPPAAPLRRFTFDLPWRSVPNWSDFDAAISPTGRHLTWYGRRDNDIDVYLRALDALDAVPLTDARGAYGGMAFSPDGEWLAFHDHHGLKKVSIRGGRAQELARGSDIEGLSWGSDGSILMGGPTGLLRAAASGGASLPLTHVDAKAGETGHFHPFHLPGGRHALMTIVKPGQTRLAVVDLQRGVVTPLPLTGTSPTWSPSGHLVFRQGSTVLAVRFDPKALAVVGEAVPVLEKVRSGPHVAADGTMLYIPERGDSSARLVWVDRTGRPKPIAGQRLDYSHLSLGSGNQALLNIGSEVYQADLERGARRLLSSDDASFPIWSADGRWATFFAVVKGKWGIYRQPADGSGDGPELLRDGGNATLVPTSWNAQTGELALFDDASDIWIMSPDKRARKFLAGPSNERSGRFSPDGRWLAFVSDEAGSYQVYVVPYPGPGPKVAVSAEGGMSPIWSAEGRELFFLRGGKMFSAAMTLTPALAAARPVELFDGPYTLDLMGHQRYDVAPDGRFLMVENSDDFRIVVVEHWTAELDRLVPQSRAAR